MPQLRLMGDDPRHVEQIARVLRNLITASGVLVATDIRIVPNRSGPGCRAFFDVIPITAPTPTTASAAADDVVVERVDNPPAPRPRFTRPRRALPPGDAR